TEDRLGFKLGIGRKIGQHWTVSTGIRVEEVGVHNVPFFAPEDIQQSAGENFLVGLRGGVTYDTRDSYLRPTEGNLVEASFEQCFGDFTFPLVTLEGNQYWTVYQR